MELTKQQEQRLNDLIVMFYDNKNLLDSFKKTCDSQNKEIKDILGAGKHEYTYKDYTAKISESTKVEVDEDKMLAILKANGYTQAIKTKEYVDTDTLENLIYHNDIAPEVLKLLDDCKHEKITQTLRVTVK